MYAASQKKCPSVPEGAAAGRRESSGETLTVERATEGQAIHGGRTGVCMTRSPQPRMHTQYELNATAAC